MELRNIRRYFLFDRAMDRQTLTHQHLLVLYSISFIDQPTYSGILRFLKRNKHTMAGNKLQDNLRSLVNSGYIIRTGNSYSLSSSGYAALLSLESIARKLRPDR